MATKKKTEIVEEVQTTEEPAVEEAKPAKKTTKKSTAKKVEEPIVEEVKEPEVEPVKEPEVEIVGKKVVEVIVEPVIEEPVKVEEPEKEVKKQEGQFFVQVIVPNGVYTFKGPGLDFTKGKVMPKGSKFAIIEVKGNWGKIADDKWILLSNAVVKI